MGLDQKVLSTRAQEPAWARVALTMAEQGSPLQMRMIDGQLAFPDEDPAAEWNELRVAGAAGMVTLRRVPDGMQFVVWGNADPALFRLWSQLTWAWAHLSGADVEAEGKRYSATEFRTREGESA